MISTPITRQRSDPVPQRMDAGISVDGMPWFTRLCLVGVGWGLLLLVAGFLPLPAPVPDGVQTATGLVTVGVVVWVIHGWLGLGQWKGIRPSIPQWWWMVVLSTLAAAFITFVAFLIDGARGRPVLEGDAYGLRRGDVVTIVTHDQYLHVQLLEQRSLGAAVAVFMAASGAVSAGRQAASDAVEHSRGDGDAQPPRNGSPTGAG